ncbi:unnamed protein product [Clonostachys byssicola]|uniref:Uncharacterized protein n=1 Tax=Clonostachys byssicola TaxID=160290 RepID=A0A9N9V1B5_9HYPO|nr:unnamed protein product [Clonostachys byssicola]
MGHGPAPFGPPPPPSHGHGHGHGHGHPHGPPPPPPPPPHAAHGQHTQGQAVPILAIIFGSIVLIVLIINVFKFAQFYLEHHATHSQDEKQAKPCNGNCQCQGLAPNPKQRPGVDPPPYSNNNELEERRRLMDEDGSNYVP